MSDISGAQKMENRPAGFTPGTTNTGVFDLSNAEGLNESERLLTKLCQKSFLSLWSFPNLHTDRDLQGGKGSAKELSDVLAVFGNDIVIFSDKHVIFQDHKQLDVAWPRWYRSAVADSAKQLHGAMSWLLRFPERVFLDAQCTRPLPVKLPSQEHARFHLIAVTRGSFGACAAHFPGSLGTLQVNSGVDGADHLKHPFTIGNLDANKKFVHVLDEFSLEVVLRELDTVSDFVTYLQRREVFLSSKDTKVHAAGEEQLLTAYIRNMSDDEHSFLPSKLDGTPDIVFFDESHYPELIESDEYERQKNADRQSYFWDHLIEKFIRIGDPTLAHPDIQQTNVETERALRTIAGENRFRRRLLVDSLFAVMRAAPAGKRRARILTSKQLPDLVYIFLVQPRPADESYEQYRRHRAALLHAYCRCAKLRYPDATRFVGIGVDHPIKSYPGVSEDLMVYESPGKLSEEDRAEAENFRGRLGIFGAGLTEQAFHADEFPRAKAPTRPLARESSDSAKEAQRVKKRKDKVAKASVRRNRR